MKAYAQPPGLPRNPAAGLTINGAAVETLATGTADFSIVAMDPEDFPARVEINAPPTTRIRPLSAGIPCSAADGRISFTLPRPMKLSIDPSDGSKPHYFFANPPETAPPAPGTPGVIAMRPGEITEIPLLEMEDGQTLYLPGGSVLKGRIHVKGKSDIRICGHGIFDGGFDGVTSGGKKPSILLEHCVRALVEDITMIRPCGWMLVPAACRGVTVRNLKQIGEVLCSDGIDILGSSDVLVEDCFLHNNDDCIAVKAFDLGGKNLDGVRVDARKNVENVIVQRCTLANAEGGNAVEIGHELAVDSVRGVTFRDIDILHVHGHGAVFAIHNCDRATISDILYENIRIEHCYDKLIDFRITTSFYSTDAERGRIRGVVLRDIHWDRSRYNPGYTISIIRGADADHAVDDVRITDFFLDGRRVENLDELEIAATHCRGLRLENTAG